MKLFINAAIFAMAMAGLVMAATDPDPFYEILHEWPGNFKANFCITAPQDLYGWKLKLKFLQPVSTLNVPNVRMLGSSSDKTFWRMRDSGWNGRWLEGQRRCFQAIGSQPGITSGIMAKAVGFLGLTAEAECPEQVKGQLFQLTVVSHWQTGLTGQFCLRVPRDFNGWKILFEMDRRGITNLNVYNAEARNVFTKMTWLLANRQHNAILQEGQTFCLGFQLSTRKWLMPCIRAFFTEDDGTTPIEVDLPSTPAPTTAAPTTTTTQTPTTQPPTTQPPSTTQPPTTTTQPPTTQPPTTQPPTTQPPTTQPPTTQPPTTTTQPPTTQPPTTTQPPPTTQSPTTQPTTTQPPTTQPPTTQPPTTTTTTQPPTTTTQPPTTTQAPTTTTTSNPSNARYDYSEALSKSLLFYMAQRSGPLPDDVISWRGDSAVNDGTQGPDGRFRNLSGGWYDAGDFLKLNFPMAGSTTVLLWGLLKFEDGYSSSGQLQRMREVVRWPLDYFLKCWDNQNQIFYGQVGNVALDHNYWGRPEDMTMDRPAYKLTTSSPGSDLTGETAAALAAGYLAFKDVDASYANTLLQAAQELYSFADNNRGYYHNSITDAGSVYRSYGYTDELCWGAAWLYKATGESTYKAKAEANVGSGGEFSWDDKGIGCVVLLHEMETDSAKKQQYAATIDAFTAKWRAANGMGKTPCGLSWLRQWGSLRYALNAALISLMAAEDGVSPSANRQWTLSQLNFALGDNKNGRSYVVGFGVNPPERPHHASSSCPSAPATCDWGNFNLPDPNPHVLYGALVGGPDVNGNYVDDRTDYVMNEVACDYNAGFQTVLAGMVSLEARNELPTANPTCPQPRPDGSSPAPTNAPTNAPTIAPTTSGPSGPTSPPDMSGSKNQEMLDLYTNVYQGDGTYYGEGRSGTCTYDVNNFPAVGLSSQIDALAALNQIKFFNSKSCGMCFKVTGNGVGAGNDPLDGVYYVFVKDLCPNGACNKAGSVDFALNGDGRWDIEIQAVQCPVGNNKLQYSFQGSNPWYLKLQVANYRIPPNEVSIQRNGQWKTMTKTSDGYWTLSDGVEMTNTANIPVRVTAINGETLTDSIPQLANSQVMNGQQGVQFALDPTLPTM